MSHLDETGQPCVRHALTADKLLDYATLGSRAAGFHHDAASKLQSLMMALDEISELIGEDPSDLRVATETAQSSLRELHGLLTANRALAKAPQRKPTPLADLVKVAAERNAVKLSGNVSGHDVLVGLPSCTHALSMLLDLVAGPTHGGRVVRIHVAAGDKITLTIDGNVEPTHSSVNELIAIAAHLLAREQGTVRCAAKGFIVELPPA